MACSRCRRKAAMTMSAPSFSTNGSLQGDTPVCAKSTIMIKAPSTQLLLVAGRSANISASAASELLEKGAPIWIPQAS